MVSAKETLRALTAQLKQAGVTEYSFEAGEIFKEAVGKHPLFVDEITKEQYEKINSFAERRVMGEPLQYIFGKWEFFGLPFFVGEGVLIPRPETELLVREAIEACGEGELLDLCSGTGCIAIAAAKNTRAKVYAAELYDAAFSYLERNIALNNAKVYAVKGDARDNTLFGERLFDMIVSNPPYLTGEEMASLQREVRYEPESALFGGRDGLDFYRAIVPLWKERLKENGRLAFEVGDGQAEAVSAILASNGFSVVTRADIQGIKRVVSGEKL